MNSSRGDVPALKTCKQANNMSTILKQKLHNNRAYTYIYTYIIIQITSRLARKKQLGMTLSLIQKEERMSYY